MFLLLPLNLLLPSSLIYIFICQNRFILAVVGKKLSSDHLRLRKVACNRPTKPNLFLNIVHYSVHAVACVEQI